jgi:regulator of sigma E protease
VLLFAVYGKPSMTAQIGQVMPGKPAAIAGLRAGDKVVSIDGKAVTIDTLVPTIDASKGSPMDFLVADDTKAERHVVVKAEKDSTGGKDVYRIGVRPTFVFEPCSFGVAWVEAASTTAQYGSKLVSIVKAGKTKDAVGGPVGIAQTFYALAGTGAQTRIELLASLSLSLFIFNMFPIPILDGGHLVLLTIEAIRRKKLSAINMQRVYLAGAAIMGLLFLTIMWNDVVKLIAPK